MLSNNYSDDLVKFSYIESNTYNTKPDFYALSLGFFVSRITSEPRWFFAIVSLIYTFLFLKFLEEAVIITGVGKEWTWKFLFLFLALLVPYYVGVTGVRFWTALFLFITYVFKYLRSNKLIYLILFSLSLFIHYTFIFPVAVFFLYKVLNFSKLISHFLILSSIAFFLFTSTSGILDFVGQSLNVFSETSIQSRASAYTDQEYFEDRQAALSEANWYVTLRVSLINFSFLILFILDYLNLLKLRKDKFLEEWNLLYTLFFCTTLLSFSLGSLARFNYIFFLISLIRLMYLHKENQNRLALKRFATVMTPVLILHILVTFRACFYFVDPLLLIGNPISLFLAKSDISLSELIVGH